ncbi:hypothetical protein C1I95_12655 [Micromonospora craterilacus]|uniref:Uncharacterized protein n=1 Tax=Micromonospora craterilacus TaxID=1655439 RepID=A0A2W2E8P1_9ACTN|nr:hypothetical protein [Micromonospora craterilacus]PZG18923.1 hypothetical protein C1I95_12655 [Micromonospora craterilacus]
MTNPQQQEFRRNAQGGTSQDNKGPGPAGHPRNAGSSSGDTGRPVPHGQVSPYGPAAQPVAEDDSDRR